MEPIQILLIEDNEGDIFLTREAFDEGRICNTIQVVRDGQEGIDFLKNILLDKNLNLPDLILLDVNLPKMNGHEVLLEIKKSDDLKHIPVIMLTTSSSEVDILKSYQNHANCYISKPVDVNDFMNAIQSIEEFWMSIVKLPKHK